MKTIYLELTEQFNRNRLRAIICSGQAVVLHKLAVMSKDGDWIVREDQEALDHIIQVLSAHNASYRFGAPLDVRWMTGGWSAHFEFQDMFRVRTDFFTRPPRLSRETLARIWKEQQTRVIPFLDPPDLAELKKTNREKDYVIIGELGRIMENPADQLLYSRSARDLIRLAGAYPHLIESLVLQRPLLRMTDRSADELARALDDERRDLIRRNEIRLSRYLRASREWQACWPELNCQIGRMPLVEAHHVVVEHATIHLPFSVETSNE
jgi:hypothetical protein